MDQFVVYEISDDDYKHNMSLLRLAKKIHRQDLNFDILKLLK